MNKYRFGYKYQNRFGNKYEHIWHVVGQHGGMHLHIDSYEFEGKVEFTGGLETHWRKPPEYMENTAPHHDNCWLLKCPCWHDGTSLYVQETIIPRWIHRLESDEGFTTKDHERMFEFLGHEMDERFGG